MISKIISWFRLVLAAKDMLRALKGIEEHAKLEIFALNSLIYNEKDTATDYSHLAAWEAVPKAIVKATGGKNVTRS